MIHDKDRKMEEIILEVLEDFNSYSTNISSEISRRMIAKAVIKKIKKIYNYDVKYFYS
jgi:predicted methyltransferase